MIREWRRGQHAGNSGPTSLTGTEWVVWSHWGGRDSEHIVYPNFRGPAAHVFPARSGYPKALRFASAAVYAEDRK